jgi:hypothetical protein
MKFSSPRCNLEQDDDEPEKPEHPGYILYSKLGPLRPFIQAGDPSLYRWTLNPAWAVLHLT